MQVKTRKLREKAKVPKENKKEDQQTSGEWTSFWENEERGPDEWTADKSSQTGES